MQNLLFVLLLIGSVTNINGAGQFINFPYGGRSNKLLIPSSYDGNTPLPLYVMLHGCTQDPTDFSKGTKMNDYGEKYSLLVLYPEQPTSANQNKCWNWFEPAHQHRGKGEPLLIAGMVNEVKKKYKVDDQRVYVGGLSAGAAFSVIMGATYSDIFSAIAVGAGLEYEAATSVTSALTAMSSGGPDPYKQGEIAYKEESTYINKSVSSSVGVLVIHGTSDYTVNKKNGDQVISQWAKTNDFSIGKGQSKGIVTDVPDMTENLQVPGGRSYTIQYYNDETNDRTLMMYVIVDKMGHAWSGGSSSGSYTDPSGPDASLIMIQFFSTFPWSNSTTSSSSTSTSSSSSTSSSTSSTSTSDTSSSSTGTSSSTSSSSSTSTSSTSTSTTGGGLIKTFYAVPSQTGYVGQYPADGYSTDDSKVGDKGMYNTDTYRTILSFDISDLGNQNISKAFLRLCRKSLEGSVTSVSIDIKQGYFGNSLELDQTKYSSSPSALNIATWSEIPSTNDECSQITLPINSYQFISSSNVQFRLKSTTTPSFNSNILHIWGGNDEDFNKSKSASLIIYL